MISDWYEIIFSADILFLMLAIYIHNKRINDKSEG